MPTTVLHELCVANNPEALKTSLVRPNAEVNTEDEQGRTPIYLAMELGRVECAEILIADHRVSPYGVPPKRDRTVLDMAMVGKHQAFLRAWHRAGRPLNLSMIRANEWLWINADEGMKAFVTHLERDQRNGNTRISPPMTRKAIGPLMATPPKDGSAGTIKKLADRLRGQGSIAEE